MSRTVKTVLDTLAFPEGPRWHDGALYFSDMHAHEVVAMKPDGSRTTAVSLPGPCSGLGWLPDGRMLVVSMEDRKLMRQDKDGKLVVHADLSGIATGLCNDMVVAADGTAYVGNFGFSLHPPEDPKPAKLAGIRPDGSTWVAAENLMFPNGMVIAEDGQTLIVGESFGRCLTAFDIGKDGALANRREWAKCPDEALPDGICLDAEGAIWSASPYTKEVLRLAEGGKTLDRVETEQMAIACMLGGADRKTLYVLTSDSVDPEVCVKTRTARIQAVEVDVAGAGRP